MHDFQTASDAAAFRERAQVVEELANDVYEILFYLIDQFDENNRGQASALLWADKPLAREGVFSRRWQGERYDQSLRAAEGLRAFMRAIGAVPVWPNDRPDLETTTRKPIEKRWADLMTEGLYERLLYASEAAQDFLQAATIAHELYPEYKGEHLSAPTGIDFDVFSTCFTGLLKPIVPEGQMELAF